MPVRRSAAASKRSRAREPEDDQIEAASSSHPRVADDVDDADEAPVRERKPNIAALAAAAAPANGDAEEEDAQPEGAAMDVDSGDDERIDVEAFGDQPLGRSDGANVARLAKDWAQLLEKFSVAQDEMMPSIAGALAEVGEPAKDVRALHGGRARG
jgi:hypothetical protein